MSDPTDAGAQLPPVAPHEELASALLDGEATAAEKAQADDPDVVRARRAHQEVARRVGRPVDPPAAADREHVIAAALAVFDAGDVRATGPARGDDELATRRARRSAPQWIAAIAAALVVLAGLGLLAGLAGRATGDDDSETAASEATEPTVAAEGRTDDGAGEGSGATESADALGAAEEDAAQASEELEAPTSASSLPYLGDFADADDAVASARQVFAARQAAGATTFAEAGGDRAVELAVPCAAALGPVSNSEVLGTATVDGGLVTLLVQTSDDGATVIVLAEPTCQPERFEP